jgi:transcription-repair coupling factor (superfamily II helicase)
VNLSGLLPAIEQLAPFESVLAHLKAANSTSPRPAGPAALGLLRAARPALVAALAARWPAPVFVLVARNERALAVRDDLAAWNPHARVLNFAEPATLFYEPLPWGPRTIRERLATLASLADYNLPAREPRAPLVVVASLRAWMTPTLPRQDFLRACRQLSPGGAASLDNLVRTWTDVGYVHEPFVLEPGQYSRRGGILDVWPPAEPSPVRIEFFGGEIDTLRRFDPGTQRSTEKIGTVRVAPAREVLERDLAARREAAPSDWPTVNSGADTTEAPLAPGPEFYAPWVYPPASVLDHLPPGALLVFDDYQEAEDTSAEWETQALQLRAEAEAAGWLNARAPMAHLTWDHLREATESHATLVLASYPEAAVQIPLGEAFSPGPRFGGQIKPLLDHLEELDDSSARTILVSRQAARLAELWSERSGEAPRALLADEQVIELPPPGAATMTTGGLQEGFVVRLADETTLHLLSDGEIFGWVRPEPRRRARAAALPPEAEYADLNPDDFVVHVEYGIGRFAGLVRRTVEGTSREYLQVEFAGGDQVFVPVHQVDRLTRYVGADEHPPTLSRLGTAEWGLARERARHAVEDIARELLDLYARRQAAMGIAFGPDTPWQQELEGSFPYVETEDQLLAIQAVKRDMESTRPMDRLICGDVGYGKTEVALRAAFKAVMSGRQVAVLVPTTLLAQQHALTFAQRLLPFPARVEMLSRFRTPAEQQAVLGELAEGRVDVVIGTHRLLQRDVRFKDLGLVVIDEEQRFGVAHKEYLKQLRTEVDVLTLTATPIPRTLYLSLTGVRDISTIDTPPQERLPVVTSVGAYSEGAVRKAILRELDRGGQVFYVHNRVETILAARQRLERIIPEARLVVAHGQMHEHELERAMAAFLAREVDVLLCTSIIESGLDIPSANTLVVERADTFGLAQLYQLRGRVGRSAMRGYAYFFTERRHRPTPEAHERLQTLAEQTELGAGYSIAMRDLEIRGAGEILGARQHGHIAAIGFHLYTRLLAQAVRRARDQREGLLPGLEAGLVSVDLPLNASLPDDYVPSREARVRLYRRMADLTREGEVLALAQEMEDRFGALPEAVEHLLYQLRVKVKAQEAGVESVSMENRNLVLRLYLPQGLEPGEVPEGMRYSRGTLYIPAAVPAAEWKPTLTRALEWVRKWKTSAAPLGG